MNASTPPSTKSTQSTRLSMRLGLGFLALMFVTVAPDRTGAFQVDVSSGDFPGSTNILSGVTSFSISIEILGPLRTGVFVNPALGDIEFLVQGSLDPSTPARIANPAFTGFAVEDRPALRGEEFYGQGNALTFEIRDSAELSDGLQVSELVGAGLVFEFDGQEMNTGRYHPPIFQLFADGTGSIRNSNNTGGINPFTGVEVNASIGDEYITNLAFDPSAVTLVVPEPSTALLLSLGLLGLSRRFVC
jgi:hypothetical protein